MADEPRPFHNPFGVLSHLRGETPVTPATPDPVPPAAPTTAPSGARIPRAVVRLQRTGRGGKEVTVVEHLNLPPAERERWLKALKTELGCGGVIEDGALVLQGDQRERLPKWLMARGVKKVTVA